MFDIFVGVLVVDLQPSEAQTSADPRDSTSRKIIFDVLFVVILDRTLDAVVERASVNATDDSSGSYRCQVYSLVEDGNVDHNISQKKIGAAKAVVPPAEK